MLRSEDSSFTEMDSNTTVRYIKMFVMARALQHLKAESTKETIKMMSGTGKEP